MPSTSQSTEDEPAAQSGYNHWTTPSPSRTRLSLNSHFYMDKTRLAEYQRYLGPECAKTRTYRDWASYLDALIQHAAGGEEHFLKRLLQRRKAQNGMTVLDDALTLAGFGTPKKLIRV